MKVIKDFWNGLSKPVRMTIIICVTGIVIALIATGQFLPLVELFK